MIEKGYSIGIEQGNLVVWRNDEQDGCRTETEIYRTKDKPMKDNESCTLYFSIIPHCLDGRSMGNLFVNDKKYTFRF